MMLAEQRPLGCSRCRYSKNGCSRCRNPAFKPRAVKQQLLAEGKPTQHAAVDNSSSLLSTSHDADEDGGIPRCTSAPRRSKRVPAGVSCKSAKRKAVISRAQHQQQVPVDRTTPKDSLQSQQQTTGHAAIDHNHQLQQHQQSLTVIAAGGGCEQQQQQRQQQQSQNVQPQCGCIEPQQHSQQQQHTDEEHTAVQIAATNGSPKRGNKRVNHNDIDNSLTKRLRKALRLHSTPAATAAAAAEPAAGMEAAEQALVPTGEYPLLPSSDTAAAAAAAATGIDSPTHAADDDGHWVTDGGARKHGAAAAATAKAITPYDVEQPAAAAATTAAAAAPVEFERLLQQRIQQQLSQGRQPLLPNKRSAAAAAVAAAGSSPAATKHSRRAGTPTQQQHHVATVANSLPLSPFSPAAAAAAKVTNSSSSSADSVPRTAAALTPSPQTLPTKRRKPKSSTPKTTKPYKAPKPYTHLALPGINPRVCVPGWSPPVSPYGLLEEELWQDPWKLLLACMLLNKTSGKQVRIVLWDLLALCPTPAAAAAADTDAIRDIIYPLGLFNKRAVAVQRLSQDFIHKNWTCPTDLYGIGKYAADAYYMFCRGQWQGVQPDDKDLIKYHEWMRATGGLGTGLTGLTGPQTLTTVTETTGSAD